MNPQTSKVQTSKTIVIRGKEYTQHPYDWYIDEALFLAPEGWSYEQIVSLRDAIRENYQHGHNLHTYHLEKNAQGLKHFIQTIIANDPAATICHEDLWIEDPL